ncbi:MAG: PAS domain S-box protein [Candidatus Lokiarchaeota archaeon]|nr:PAS domain S-box protein [Candidatus Lokiarchaeota archaeon]
MMGPSKMTTIHVLIIDDDDDLLEISKRFVNKIDDTIEITTVNSGKRGLEILASMYFDVVVCDFQMEKMNGLDVLKTIREQQNQIPFIMFTGHSHEQIAIQALNLGATNYLTKTGNPKTLYTELVHLIRRAVEHDRTERALRESEELYRSLVEASPDAVFVFNLEGKILRLNQQAKRLLGIENIEEIIGKDYRYWLVGKQAKTANIEFEKLVRGEALSQREYKFTLENGEPITVEAHSTSLKNSHGEPVGILAVVRDITRRNAIEEEIRISEERLRSLANNIDSAIWLSSPSNPSKIIYLNPGFEQIWEVPVEHALQNPEVFTESIHPEDKARVETAIADFVREQIDYNLQYRILTGQGELKWIWAKGFFILGKEKGVRQFGGIAQDITEWKKTQKALEESLTQFDRLFAASINGVALCDTSGILKQANSAILDMLGYEHNELIGKNISEFTVQEYHEDFFRTLSEMRIDTQIRSLKYEYYHKNGTRIPVSLNIWTNIDQNDEIIGYWIIIRDISKQKDMIEKLSESKEKYRRERERLSELAHHMRHDLVAGLQNIEAFSELIKDNMDFKLIDRIRENARQMRKVLDRSVELADAGLVIGKMQQTDMAKLVDEVAYRVIPENVTVEHKNLPIVKCDREKIEQVLHNILTNAIQHGKAKTIVVFSQELESELQIVIRNDGESIPDKIRKQIFRGDYFLRTSESLGMQIVRRIIEAHGWSITLDEGEPVSFRISIPRK